tara:strand:- start:196 stop:387 length:192 start_codon:yes stop_codon:yes gene_type:complete
LEEPFSIDWLKLSVSPENIFSASVADLRRVHGVGDKVATAISGFDVDRATDREFGLALKEHLP